jgi:hypothetical protein
MIEGWSSQAFDDAFQPIQEFEIQCARDRDRVVAEESGFGLRTSGSIAASSGSSFKPN